MAQTNKPRRNVAYILAAVLAVGVAVIPQAAWSAPSKAADLALSLTDAPDPARVGADVTYTLIVSNQGPGNAANSTVIDDLHSSVTLVSASASQGWCDGTAYDGETHVHCTLGPLAKGVTATVTIRVQPMTSGSIPNSAFVQSQTADPNTNNNTAMTSTTVDPNPTTGIETRTAPSVWWVSMSCNSMCTLLWPSFDTTHITTRVMAMNGDLINEGTVVFRDDYYVRCTAVVVQGAASCSYQGSPGGVGAKYSGSAKYAPSESVSATP